MYIQYIYNYIYISISIEYIYIELLRISRVVGLLFGSDRRWNLRFHPDAIVSTPMRGWLDFGYDRYSETIFSRQNIIYIYSI